MHVRGDGGVVVARAACGLPWFETLAGLDPAAFPMLGSLDPYRDAAFRGPQLPALIDELERLPAECGGPWVAEVRELCRIAAGGISGDVWFIGD
ncbi:hypothetical protein [Yinghuangia soli]|uniref:Uncharacterized protein n=1 Tax=Yinghuangia soli TaxID=2908204 RepID=A0AA41U2H8_9ACTN|nr:hypothetical protein [Yinghuangia soli]MCF2527129.1 hypothetical protein [Yinghuangia soli]